METKFCGDYVLIGGGIENDEIPEDAIVREVAEETGISGAQIVEKNRNIQNELVFTRIANFRTMLNHVFVIKLDDSK